MSLTFTDIFCGAGGSSIGLAAAGFELKLAANHWQTAINTHSANFPQAEHVCADVNNYDMRRLPKTDVLWASPICTEISPAGGTKGRRTRPVGQGDLLEDLEAFGPIRAEGFDRTRATFWDVIRATEVHRYAAVLVENVPDVIDRWELFDVWLLAMARLGYAYQLVSANSAHVGGPGNQPAPQWRDRLYIVLTRDDIPIPDVSLRPVSYCQRCDADVDGVQTWCDTARHKTLRAGRYRRNPTTVYGQYWYTCPRCTRRVEPYVLPAATAIDWTDVGTRIGDLRRPLKPNTMRRIEAGLAMFAQPFMANNNHGGDDTRLYPPTMQPLTARTTRIGDGLCLPPMLVPAGGTWNERATNTLSEPMVTRLANEKGYEALLTPQPFIALLRNHGEANPVSEPLATITAGGRHHALIVPYYTTGTPAWTDQPLSTVTTKDRHALVHTAASVDDAHYRMTKPRESLTSQRFPADYRVHGNQGEQGMQAGNAVSANVAQWLATRVAEVLQ
jgi:DNA (cytosine-5)-methyltransferase 1